MKKLHYLPFIFLFLCYTQIVFGQESSRRHISIGPEIGVPFGFGDVYSTGLGLSGKIIYPIKPAQKLSVTGSAGYFTMVPGKEDNELESGRFTVVPIMVGLQYPFYGSVYGSFETGLALGVRGTDKRFAMTPGIGLSITNNLDLGLRYHLWNGSGLLALKLGYKFNY